MTFRYDWKPGILALGAALALCGCVEKPKQPEPAPPTPAQEEPMTTKTEPPAPVAPKPQAPAPAAAPLDADGNGLYEPAERKRMLDALQAQCPELAGIVFDADGDGQVTVAEQTAGRHPLSQLVKRESVAAGPKIPWTIDLFSEWMMSAFFQEDVAEGAVAVHPTRGVLSIAPAQENAALQPVRKGARSGVEFAADSGAHLVMPGHRDARWSYRWCVLSFRIDGATGSGDQTMLLDVNKGNGPGKSSPRIAYSKTNGLTIQYVGRNASGLDRRVMKTRNVVTDGRTWNVVVCGIRQGRMFAAVNGAPLATETEQPGRFSTESVYETTSCLGGEKADNMAWAYDALVLGQTEISEAMVEKLGGWAAHRLGFQANLPAAHAYRDARPVLDAEDLPHRYVHDDDAWAAWGLRNKDKTFTRSNAGGPRVEPSGFERVFYDDFRAFRISKSTSGEGDLWTGFGFNTAVGADAPLVEPGREPDVYPYDAQRQLQGLSLAKQGSKWRGSAFYSVNDMGQGHTWSGPKVFRIRCMFPKVPKTELAGGLFPAFWSYGMEFINWRTSNRIECDWFEFDGVNPRWYNGLSTHYHYTHVKSIFAKQTDSYQRYKLYGGELTEEKSKIPGGVYFWDGQFHTWEFVIDADMTYVNVTIPDGAGGDRWVEICRGATAPTYLERLDLQLDYALKAKQGVPKTDARQDFIVDWIEVLQKTASVAAVPAPFTARPSLAGDAKAGGTVTCAPNVQGVADLRYYWFADGYPLTYGADPSYTLAAADAGKTIRCLVKAVGALDMPEAWTEGVRVAGAAK